VKGKSPLRIASREAEGACFRVLEAGRVPPLAECFVAGVENDRGGREVMNPFVQGENRSCS